MKLKSKINPNTEIQQFNKFISTLKNPLYKIDFNSSGQILSVDSINKKIIAWAKDKGLK